MAHDHPNDEPSQPERGPDARGGGNGETPHAGPAETNVDQPQAVHRTGGPPVDPAVARAEEPHGGNGNGEEAVAVPVDAQGQSTEELDRLAAPVGHEQPPKLPFVVAGIGASAGGVEAFTEFLLAMPEDTGMAFVLIVHLPPDRHSLMAEVLSNRTRMPVVQVEDGMAIEPNHVYVIRPGRTLLMADGHLQLTESLGARGHARPVDDFFRSLAAEQRERAVAVVLSGMGSNGTAGAQAIKAVGGVCIAQEPESALYPSMPRHLIDQGNADYILRPRDIPGALIRLAGHPYARGAEDAAVALQREQQDFADVLTILRTRTRQDFSGYKRPTLFRRVQRRMGLNQITRLGDYVRLLRNNAAEVQALADDLLIHVTGFFRDPGGWESLRDQVIAPLIASREGEQAVRCWVTACSSGEEAYTLAMLIAEAMDRLDKHLDVKIFATDMAERSLGHARAGTFPMGIEGEISGERLERFFERDDATYRVKKELRDMVVFAPQNVLQDPPFSRLDICTCRNLLIYLEPEVQRRVLALLHFGLRDGGALFLGTSETVAGAEDMFEPIDKKWRLYRRIGPTRHGQVDFPLPRVLSSAAQVAAMGERPSVELTRATQRLSVAQLTERALLHRYTPAAVVIDREYRIVFFHGPTDRFVAHPAGEPTRELLLLCRDTVRGAVRAALTQAVEGNGSGQARDGTIQADHGMRRVWVSVAPLEGKPGGASSQYFLVSFEERDEPAPSALPPGTEGTQDDVIRLTDELARVRDELQSTIEELQSSNEELKASNEEVTSINEELQSSNEELETSKEELQSLNEELTTVNAQLQAKNEELQGTSSDLQSLLASTDIGVVFLDTRMRIRRFTPAVRELLDLISSDVGRPLSDLNRKFEDETLLDDARAVLQKLVPIQTEVRAPGAGPRGADKWFQRRVTPYRTSDDRIDGVVVTFVDVTARQQTERALRTSDDRLQRMVNIPGVGVMIFDKAGTLLEANDAFLEMTGYTRAQVTARQLHWRDLTPPEHILASEEQMRILAQTGRIGPYEKEYLHANGSRSWMLFAGASLGDGMTVEYCVDIGDRKHAEAALRESELRFEAIANLVPDLLWRSRADGYTTWFNLRWTEYTGQTLEQAVGWGWTEAAHPEDREALVRRYRAAIDAGTPLRQEYRIRSAGGDYRWFLVRAEPVRDPAGNLVMFGSASDVHEQRSVMEQLREGEQKFREVVEGAVDFAMIVLDAGNRITSWNAGAEQIFGHSKEDAIGQEGSMIFTPEDRAAGAVERELSEARRSGRAQDERWHLRQDGTRFWGSGVMALLPDGDDEPRGFVKVLRDETDRRQAEEVILRAKETAESANVMKDQFLATLSHELRTPLSAILIYAKLLQANLVKDPANRDAVDAITRSAEAQRQLIDDLLDSARITSGKLHIERRETDLREVLREAIEAVAPAADAKGVALEVKAGEGVSAWVDPGRIRQVIWNLLNNAVKFTTEGGHVGVTLATVGKAVEIRVSDTGQGIPQEFLAHVFDPFRQADASITRTKGGLGLGLAISRHLVELHGGTIRADSAGAGKGATFTVRLPLPNLRSAPPRPPRVRQEETGTATTNAAAATLRAESHAPLGGVRVLLVEDDAETRQAVERLLASWGAKVSTAPDAPAARAAIGMTADGGLPSGPAPFDLLLCDIGLPGENGYDLINALRAAEAAAGGEAPGMPAVAMTAFVRDSDRDQALAAGFDRYVSKPAAPDDLLTALRQALGRA